jgi:hypothetical protein
VPDLYVPLNVNYPDDVAGVGPMAELLYVRALCLAKRLGSDGELTDVHVMRLTADLKGGAGSVEPLVAAGLWERLEGGYRITAWLKHNLSRGEIEARKAADRGRKRRVNPVGIQSESSRNGTGEGSDSTSESEGESEVKKGGGALTHAPPRRRGTRIPLPFEVDDAMAGWVRRECPQLGWERETEKFCDYWKAAAGRTATKLDWPATWRVWMRRASEDRRGVR